MGVGSYRVSAQSKMICLSDLWHYCKYAARLNSQLRSASIYSRMHFYSFFVTVLDFSFYSTLYLPSVLMYRP